MRYTTGTVAEGFVLAGTALPFNPNGKIKQVKLICSASHLAQRIGAPDGDVLRPQRFVVKEHLECGGIAWKFHSRSLER